MATCTYSPPNSNSNPNNSVTSIGFGVPFKAYNDWANQFCSGTSDFSSGNPNCHPTLESNLDSWINNMNYYAKYWGGYGDVQWVGHGGAFVDHRTSPSYHRTGEAIDLWWIHWNGRTSRPCNSPYEMSYTYRHRRYLAVEASLRKYFGYVLDYKIDAHENHFHVDNGCPTAMNIKWYSTARAYRSTAYFIQDCARTFNGSTTAHDGIWGNGTESAYNSLLWAMNLQCLNPKSYLSHYRVFLDYIQMHGFANKSAGYYRYGGCSGPQ